MTPKLTKAQERFLLKIKKHERLMPEGPEWSTKRNLMRQGLLKLCVNTIARYELTEAGRKVCEELK